MKKIIASKDSSWKKNTPYTLTATECEQQITTLGEFLKTGLQEGSEELFNLCNHIEDYSMRVTSFLLEQGETTTEDQETYSEDALYNQLKNFFINGTPLSKGSFIYWLTSKLDKKDFNELFNAGNKTEIATEIGNILKWYNPVQAVDDYFNSIVESLGQSNKLELTISDENSTEETTQRTFEDAGYFQLVRNKDSNFLVQDPDGN